MVNSANLNPLSENRNSAEHKQGSQEHLDDGSPILNAFKKFSVQLDSKHDRNERIYKLSRDACIESKRIIFLLHTIDRDSKREKVLAEAEKRLELLSSTAFLQISKELEGRDPYQFIHAFGAGLEEYVEAVTFLHYLRDNALPHWIKVQDQLSYEGHKILLSPTAFFCGVGDLTGELMRFCIQSLSSGAIRRCHETCAFVRDLHIGFLGLGYLGSRDLGRKVTTLQQSLAKMEMACYTIAVRGNEVPGHMLAYVLSSTDFSSTE